MPRAGENGRRAMPRSEATSSRRWGCSRCGVTWEGDPLCWVCGGTDAITSSATVDPLPVGGVRVQYYRGEGL